MLYSSAGFGGGSSYLSLLAITGASQFAVRWIAYLCNMAVTGLAQIKYRRQQVLSKADVWPWFVGSIPMAYLGGTVRLTERFYFLLLGISLLIASALLLVQKSKSERTTRLSVDWRLQVLVGASIGLLSGLVGIGGGIFLAPVLHLANWQKAEKIAALSSLFILVNAAAGAVAFAWSNGFHFPGWDAFVLVIAVMAGGYLGASFSLSIRGKALIRAMTGILVGIVAFRLLIQYS